MRGIGERTPWLDSIAQHMSNSDVYIYKSMFPWAEAGSATTFLTPRWLLVALIDLFMISHARARHSVDFDENPALCLAAAWLPDSDRAFPEMEIC